MGRREGMVASAVAPPPQAPAAASPPVARSRGRSRYFVVEADPVDPKHGPVAVLSGHTSQKAATAALGKAQGRGAAAAGEGERLLLQVRTVEQITSRLVWDSEAKRGVVQPGSPP